MVIAIKDFIPRANLMVLVAMIGMMVAITKANLKEATVRVREYCTKKTEAFTKVFLHLCKRRLFQERF
jgi:hypothetical protein